MGFFNKLFKNSTSKPDLGKIQNKDIVTDDKNFEAHPLILPERKMDEATKDRLIELFVQNNLVELFSSDDQETYGRDELFEDAAYLIVTSQQGSTSLIQRKLKLGYNRAGRIIDELESAGIVGSFDGAKAREVKIKTELELEQFLKYLRDSTIEGAWDGSLRMSDGLASFYQDNSYEIISKSIQKKIIEKQKKQEEQDLNEKEEIKRLLLERERKKRLHKEALSELIEDGAIFNELGKREFIPQEVMDKVWNRDGGRCAKCGSNENLEFDHIIPFSKGGATTYRNIQLLCKKCNNEKSNKIG